MAEPDPTETPLVINLEILRHDPGLPLGVDDPFRQFVNSLPKKHWAKYDLSACAFGWNAALDEVKKHLRR